MKQRHPNILQVLGVLIDQNYGPVEAPSTQVLLVLERCNYDLHSGLKVWEERLSFYSLTFVENINLDSKI